MKQPMWDNEAVKAYETGQGVELVNVPHPHYQPLPEDLNPDALETVEIDLPQRTWVELTETEILLTWEPHMKDGLIEFARAIEAKLKDKNI